MFDCAAVLTACAVAPWMAGGRSAAPAGGRRLLAQMSYAELAGQLATRFQVRVSPGQIVHLRLLKAPLARATPARLDGQAPGDAGYEKFSLLFSGPNAPLLASAIHPFEHEILGRFDMFISPIGPLHGDDVRYQAGFNRPPPLVAAAVTST